MTKSSKLAKRILYIFASLVIIFALLVSLGRLLTPILNDHLPDFESWSSELLKVPVKIAHVEISWNVYEPEIAFHDVTVLDPKTHISKLKIHEIKVNLNIMRSLFTWTPVTESIKIRGLHLTLVQTPSGLWVEELRDLSTGNTPQVHSNLTDILGWAFSQSSLIFKDVDIIYKENAKPARSFTISRLILSNTLLEHRMLADAVLNQELPLKLRTQFNWTGEITDLDHVTAEAYIYLEGINLPQWVSQSSWKDLHIENGIGSAKIWATWQNNQFQSVQTQLQFYDLTIRSLQTLTSISLPRFSGHFGWKKKGDKQIYAGEDILIDLPEHLWPTTKFEVIVAPHANQPIASVAISYLDLKDAKRLGLDSGLIPKEIATTLNALNLHGVIQDFKLTQSTESNTDKLSQTTVAMKFSKLGLNAWEQYPGVTGASGAFVWDGKQGSLLLNSQNFTLDYPKIFERKLAFDQFDLNSQWQRSSDGSWNLYVKNLQAQNPEINLGLRMNLLAPLNDSPMLSLSANFDLKNAVQVTHYLPMKTYEPDLANWLHRAFLAGEVRSGKAIVQGKLADFPFENGKGNFLISGLVTNVDLKFDPSWPAITNINGVLTFTGNSMTADFDSAKIADADLTFVHAVIPDLSKNVSQILNVQGIAQMDLAQGVSFIQKTPLNETLGKDLADLNPQGPAQLKLALVIPLNKSEKVTVQGDLSINEASLMPKLANLSVDQLTGMLHFTEDSLVAKGLRGRLLNAPATIDIETRNKIITASIQSRLSVDALQTWLKMPLDKYAQGVTPYQMQIRLASGTEPTVITMTSELRGVTIDLPEPLDKKPELSKNFTATVTFKPDKPLQIKMQYNEALSGLLSFQRGKAGAEFQNGELRLGTGFNLLGQKWDNAQLQFSKKGSIWTVNVNSQPLSGQITVPSDLKQVQAKLQHFYITSGRSEFKEALDPKTLPALMINANDVRYGDFKLGNVVLNTAPAQNGMVIKQLQISTYATYLSSSGSWQQQGKAFTTRLQGQLRSSNVNQTFSEWGMPVSSLVGTNANAQFDLSWPDAPYNPSFSKITGGLSFAFGHGRIVNLSGSTEAKMGLGRMLSLLSLQSIPRRLSLDFSDLFQNGYSFDSIKGSFRLRNGSGYTNDVRLDGPVASLNLAGRIGFQAKDLDLNLGVTTYVTSSLLPAAIGWLGGPIAGVATWLVSEAVTQVSSKVATYQYTISGSWDNPVWRQIGSSKVSQPSGSSTGAFIR